MPLTSKQLAPLRIIHVPRHFAPAAWDGASSVIFHLCEQQLASGHVAEVHTSDALSGSPRETWRRIAVHRYPRSYPFSLRNPEQMALRDRRGDDFMSFGLYRSLLRLPQVRLFHAHTLGRMGGAALIAARRQKLPFVLTLHGAALQEAGLVEQTGSTHSKGVGQKRPKAQERWSLDKAFSWYFRTGRILDEADAVVCISHEEYRQAVALIGKERVHLLPNGVCPQSLNGGNPMTLRRRLHIGKDTFVFGCISRIAPEKNQLLAVEALALLRARGVDAALLLAGPVMDEAYWQKVRHRILELRLHQHCHVLPPVQLESPAHHNILAALDCFLLASVKELFGLVVLEAWAAGKPVVASNVGGLPRLISDGTDGFLFESGKAPALVEALEKYRHSPQLREKHAANGLKKVLADYTWDKIAARQEAIYTQAEEAYARTHGAGRKRGNGHSRKSKGETPASRAE